VGALVAILVFGLLIAVIVVVSGPVRAARIRREDAHGVEVPTSGSEAATGRGDLEAAREAKYREIRDAELDYRTGKLSRSDFEAIDAALRAEALEILDRLEAAEGAREGDGEE
jgi:hypothetical protein